MKLLTNLLRTGNDADKQALLKGINYNEWQTFVYAYAPDAVYNMKFREYNIQHLGEPSKEMFSLLNDVLDGTFRGDDAKHRVAHFADMHGDLIKLIVNKDLRCGVTATTFNKAHPGSIPQFKVQLAKEVPIATIKYPCLAQLKYDGVRLIAIASDGEVVFKTRNGNTVDLPDLAEAIIKVAATNYILDGEIVYGAGKNDGRTSISGAINSAMHGGRIDETDIVFHVFDTMSKREFEASVCNSIYRDRFTLLKGLVSIISKFSNMVQIATTNIVQNAEGAQQLYDGALAMGYEGLILKHEDHKYTFKRSKDWVKIKEVKTVDLTCKEVLYGTGKYEDMVGALVCYGTVEGKDVEVNVGSGLTDMARSLPFCEYFGHTIEIKYNSIIQDSATGLWSLFLPRFVTVRIDK